MKEMDRRKYPRVDTSNLIAYCCLDENDNALDYCMARAVEVSPRGVKIESFQAIDSEMIKLIAVDPDGPVIDIKCRVVHSRQTEEGKYLIGTCLAGTELENTRFTLKLIGVCSQGEPEVVMYKGPPINKKDRRKFPRVEANNLISYSCLDETGNELGHCLARVLDINPLGAKIETYQEILSENIQLTSVDVDDNLIDIVGQLAYAHRAVDGKYEIGVSFMGTSSENTDFALKLIAVCHKVEPAIVMVKSARS
jgi:c-di-GMP-binding flagellar brake protein YcgR